MTRHRDGDSQPARMIWGPGRGLKTKPAHLPNEEIDLGVVGACEWLLLSDHRSS